MHPDLRLECLNRLPAALEEIARQACDCEDPDGFVSLVALMALETPMRDYSRHFLPAFYHLLNPARIPTASQVDQPSAQNQAHIVAAYIAMNGVFQARVLDSLPTGTEVPLWLRIFEWIQFVLEFHDYVAPTPGFRNLKQQEPLLNFLDFTYHVKLAAAIRNSNDFSELFHSTKRPTILFVFFKIWELIMELEDGDTRRTNLGMLPSVILDQFDKLDAESIIAALGASFDDVAEFLVENIDLCINSLRSGSEEMNDHFHFTLNIISRMSWLEDFGHLDQAPSLTAMYSALRFRKIIKILTQALCILAATEDEAERDQEMSSEPVMSVIFALSEMLSVFDEADMRSALRHGLLRSIIRLGQRRLPSDTVHYLKAFVREIILPFNIYTPVLRILHGQLGASSISAVRYPDLSDVIQDYADCGKLFLSALRLTDPVKHAVKACDNTKTVPIDDTQDSPAALYPLPVYAVLLYIVPVPKSTYKTTPDVVLRVVECGARNRASVIPRASARNILQNWPTFGERLAPLYRHSL
ncbi:hypothetical protein MIND_00632100 [Mycena indigotica]|uniref:Uncharacterized protein n=1 Tax=Mycena indigotica TaxID=2126181 RepID=A0A8H6SRD4_9AGAR|nr:uncharacterized protein MIND_00632100 [Mycena indigotica]KAF7304009.1 hypothetical protein MIND_00632100 [Mycena indigotica]